MANRISALGEEVWDSPLRIAGCGLGIGGEQMKRPPVSVANRLCHPKALDPGSSYFTPPDRNRSVEDPDLPGMTRNVAW
jgi:hypothetical protein